MRGRPGGRAGVGRSRRAARPDDAPLPATGTNHRRPHGEIGLVPPVEFETLQRPIDRPEQPLPLEFTASTEPGTDTYLVGSVRGRRRRRRQRVRVGAPEVSLTAVAGLAAVTELVERWAWSAGWTRRSGRSSSAAGGTPPGSCWSGSPPRNWPGRTSWSGWTASAPTRPGRSWGRCRGWRSSTASGLARRMSAGQWRGGGDRGRRCRHGRVGCCPAAADGGAV